MGESGPHFPGDGALRGPIRGVVMLEVGVDEGQGARSLVLVEVETGCAQGVSHTLVLHALALNSVNGPFNHFEPSF